MCELGQLAALASASGGDPARPAPDLAPLDDPARRALLALQVPPASFVMYGTCPICSLARLCLLFLLCLSSAQCVLGALRTLQVVSSRQVHTLHGNPPQGVVGAARSWRLCR